MAAEAPIYPSRRGRVVQRYARTIPGVARATTKPIALAPLPTPPPPPTPPAPLAAPSSSAPAPAPPPRAPLLSATSPSEPPRPRVRASMAPPTESSTRAMSEALSSRIYDAEEPFPLSRRRDDSSSPSIELHDDGHDTEVDVEPPPTIEVHEEELDLSSVQPGQGRLVGAWGQLTPDTPSPVDDGELIAGRYRLLDSLGTGGMGGVWSAFDEHLRREVVVKVMSGALRGDGEARRRFEQEAHALSLVTSVHIVEMHDHGIVGDSPFIVLERLHGEDLAARLERVGHLGLVETEVLLRQLAAGIDAAHERKIVHRDLKPANIFLSVERDGAYASEVVKILDFGVAKLIGSGAGQTRSGITVGSPQFMSPEQVQGFKTLDTRSDLFALGAVVYTCLTGKLPFAGEDLGETFLRICTATFTPPSEIWQGLPRGMDPFFRKAFAVDPERRFKSATEMWSVFKAIVDAGLERTKAIATLPPPAEVPCDVVAPVEGLGRRRRAARVAVIVVAAVAALITSAAVVDTFLDDAVAAPRDVRAP